MFLQNLFNKFKSFNDFKVIEKSEEEKYLVKKNKIYLGPFNEIYTHFLDYNFLICQKGEALFKEGFFNFTQYLYYYNKSKDVFNLIHIFNPSEELNDIIEINKNFYITADLVKFIYIDNKESLGYKKIINRTLYKFNKNSLEEILKINNPLLKISEKIFITHNNNNLIFLEDPDTEKIFLYTKDSKKLLEFKNIEEVYNKLYYDKENKCFILIEINNNSKEIVSKRKKFLNTILNNKEKNKEIIKILEELIINYKLNLSKINGFENLIYDNYFNKLIIKNMFRKNNKNKKLKII